MSIFSKKSKKEPKDLKEILSQFKNLEETKIYVEMV